MSAPPSRHQRVIISLALRVLRSAMQRSMDGPVRTIEICLALHCLLPHCAERWPVESFWDAAGGDNDIGRAQGVTAGFNDCAPASARRLLPSGKSAGLT